MKHDGLSILRAPVLVEDFGSVCRFHKAHDRSPSVAFASSSVVCILSRSDGVMMTQESDCDNCNNSCD
ncbi:hypothetical protein CFBP6626_16995 [Agrobacterium tumefaciens]|nr:hypothetical protein CFBP6626_16995 [Agrobacterium tumefaciens]